LVRKGEGEYSTDDEHENYQGEVAEQTFTLPYSSATCVYDYKLAFRLNYDLLILRPVPLLPRRKAKYPLTVPTKLLREKGSDLTDPELRRSLVG
jgi:hypothetical protein